MKINKDNFEAVFLDYFDGNLSDDETEVLFDFLKHHPDLKEDFEDFENILLLPGNETYPAREHLKKTIVPVGTIQEANYEDVFIARLEGVIEPQEQIYLPDFLAQNPFLRKTYDAVQKLRLEPDKKMVYPAKAQLKKNRPLNQIVFWSAAASVILLFGVLGLLQQTPERDSFVPVNGLHPFAEALLPSAVPEKKPVQWKTSYGLNRAFTFDNMVERPSKSAIPRLTSASTPALPLSEPIAEKAFRCYVYTNLYYFDIIKSELDYYARLKEYHKLSRVEKLTYQVKNRLGNKDSDYYILWQTPSPEQLIEQGLQAFEEITVYNLFKNKQQPREKK